MLESLSISDVLALNAVLILSLVVIGAIAWRRANSRMQQRLLRLEESLRVFGSANAGVGRQVSHLDSELHSLQQRLSLIEQSRDSHVEPPARTVVRPLSAASTHLSAVEEALEPVEEEFTPAELQLAELIRSRMGELRSAVSGQ